MGSFPYLCVNMSKSDLAREESSLLELFRALSSSRQSLKDARAERLKERTSSDHLHGRIGSAAILPGGNGGIKAGNVGLLHVGEVGCDVDGYHNINDQLALVDGNPLAFHVEVVVEHGLVVAQQDAQVQAQVFAPLSFGAAGSPCG